MSENSEGEQPIEPLPETPDPVLIHEVEQSTVVPGPKFPFSLAKFARRFSFVFKIFTQLMIGILVILVVVFVRREMVDQSYVIQKINVPVSFEEAGYSGQVIANRIFSKLEDLIQNERQTQEAGEYLSAAEILDVKVDIIGTGVPVRELIEFFGRALGVPPRKKISGDLTVDGDTAILTLKFTGEKPDRYEIPTKGGMEAMMKIISMKASESILKYTSPYSLARVYLYSDADACFQLSRFLRNRYPGNLKMEAISYFVWTGGFVTNGDYALAEMKVKEGLAKFQNDINLHAAYGTILWHENRHQECLVQQKKVMSMLTSDTPLGRTLLTYSNLAQAYFYVGRSDSAEYFIAKGLRIDKNFANFHYTLARIKLFVRNDTTAFYDCVQSALEDGASVNSIYNLVEKSEIRNDPRFVKLVREYVQ